MNQVKLTYKRAIQFILDNFSSYQELISTLNKYRGSARLTSLPDLDRVVYNNQDLLNSIAGEINSGQLDLFEKGLSLPDLEFWVARHFPNQTSLGNLIELYNSGGNLDNVHWDLIVRNNFDNIVKIFNNNYGNIDNISVEDQVEETNKINELEADANEIKSGTFSIKLFNIDHNMRKYKSFSDIPTQTEYLDVLQATLQVMYFNAKESHWNAFGNGFMGIHKSFEELYEKLENYVDEIVETRMSNHDVFDSCITSFTFNSIVSQWNHQDCYLAKTVEDLTSLLNLLITNQDNLYSDLIGRLTTDANHYKYIFSRYLEAKTNNENLGDLVIKTSDGDKIPVEGVVEDIANNTIPAELNNIKSFCTTKRLARCFNELVKSFASKDRELVTKDFTDSQDAIEWLEDSSPNEFRYAYLTVKGKVSGLSFGYDRYTKGDDAELLYLHANKLKGHFESFNLDDYNRGELCDIINDITAKSGD